MDKRIEISINNIEDFLGKVLWHVPRSHEQWAQNRGLELVRKLRRDLRLSVAYQELESLFPLDVVRHILTFI